MADVNVTKRILKMMPCLIRQRGVVVEDMRTVQEGTQTLSVGQGDTQMLV